MKFLLSINYIVWLVISALFFAAGEFLSKKFALNPKATWVICIFAAYSLGTLAWLPAILQKNQLSIAGTIWSVMSLIATITIGVVIFNEGISTLGVLGIVTAFISIILLTLA